MFNRRGFIAALLAPLVAKLLPKPQDPRWVTAQSHGIYGMHADLHRHDSARIFWARFARRESGADHRGAEGMIIRIIPPDPNAKCWCGADTSSDGSRSDIACPKHDVHHAVDVDSTCINPGSSAYIDDLQLPAEYDAKLGDAK